MQLSGIHHLTAVSADAPGNVKFYTKLLGLRLVKKTVNQDDVSAYHLFYADGVASPGSDITFFDFPTQREKRGNHTITRTGMRVAGEANLRWWHERLKAAGVSSIEVDRRAGQRGPCSCDLRRGCNGRHRARSKDARDWRRAVE